MFEVKENSKVVNDIKVPTFIREIIDFSLVEVEAGTNGYQGGDAGHGSRTYFRIEDCGGTDIHVRALGYEGDGGMEVELGGDSELSTIIKALKFITKVLEDQRDKNYD